MSAETAEEPLKDEEHYTLDDLVNFVKSYDSDADTELLRKAYYFSEEAHQGQIRRSGEPYISHPLGVAAILAELKLDVATVITGLLHDTVEDTVVTLESIEKEFGSKISYLVDGVTKISKMNFRHTHEKQGENIRKMIVAMGKDIRVVLVKLADRLHNMRTLNHMSYDKQARIAQETLDIYAPLASRLGISAVKIELEDLSFRYSQPTQYYHLVQMVAKKRKEREKYIDEVKRILSQEIKNRSSLHFEVSGRPKHLYSIFRKMQTRNIDYDQVNDVLAFRVCVDSLPECYEVLGIAHSLWKPIPGRFKDFIAMPKINNYQSLHTTVIGPQAERIEIQIRTFKMHEVAERGIAAHWKYKEDSRGDGGSEESDVERFNWLRDLIARGQGSTSSDEFLENFKSDLFETEIYVFTPKGEVKEFPEGATPIDFAYSIHTDIGNNIVAARINGKLVSLKYKLQNGDAVEVITSKTQMPSKDWLKFCVTSRAKTKIRAHVKAEQRKRATLLGKEMLERSFRKAGAAAYKHLQGPDFEKLLKDYGCHGIDDLNVLVGYGRINSQHIVERMLPHVAPPQPTEEDNSFLQKAFKSAVKKSAKSSGLIRVDGMSDVLVRYGRCCHPIPGDDIVGFITRGRGVTIHRADCEKAYELDQARKIDVDWNKESSEESARVVRVRVVSHDTPGLLKSMSEIFSSNSVNIANAQVRTTRDRKAICIFDVNVKDKHQLSMVMENLKKLRGVIGVTRITHS